MALSQSAAWSVANRRTATRVISAHPPPPRGGPLPAPPGPAAGGAVRGRGREPEEPAVRSLGPLADAREIHRVGAEERIAQHLVPHAAVETGDAPERVQAQEHLGARVEAAHPDAAWCT